jgi:molybdate transport system substrate-binding protein
LREVLLASDAIFVPDTKASTAGIHVANVLQRLGIADEVAARLKIFPNGATAMRELAASEVLRPIGCTQSTEIISSKGVTLSGSLPPGCELATMYTAGITIAAAHPQQAQNLIDLLTGAGQLEQRTHAGFIGGRDQVPA